MVNHVENNGNYVDFTYKAAPRLIFRRRTATPILITLAKHYLTNTFTVFFVPSFIMSWRM